MDKKQKSSLIKMLRLIVRGTRHITDFEPYFFLIEITKSAINALTPAAVVFFSAQVISELSGNRELQKLAFLVICTVGISFIMVCIQAVLYEKSQVMETRFRQNFDAYLNIHMSQLDYPYTEQPDIIQLFRSVQANQQALNGGVFRMYQNIPNLFGALIGVITAAVMLSGMFRRQTAVSTGFITSPAATLGLIILVIICVLINAGVSMHFQKKIFRLMEDLPNSNRLIGYYEDYMTPAEAGKDIRIYNQKDYVFDIFKNRYGGYQLFIGESNASSWQNGISTAILAILNILVYLLVGLRALYGMYLIGNVVQYVGAVSNLISNLTLMSRVLTTLWTNNKFLVKQYEYLDIPDTLHKGNKRLNKSEELVIEFQNVSFRYPGLQQWALHNFSVRLLVGKRIAIVGKNGSGKTTMVKLLCRLYEPTEGRITLNGVDIKEYNYEEYKNIYSVVFQDFVFPALPIGQAVASSLVYDRERVEECMRKVGFADRMKTLPQGLDTILDKSADQNGISLSGGEEQKLALARALYKEAPFMILDEPTAALDPLSEHEIYTHFDRIISGKTAVYISHRLSSCKFCDWILVFDKGFLVGEGSHDDLLMKGNEVYSELWNAQAQYYVNA